MGIGVSDMIKYSIGLYSCKIISHKLNDDHREDLRVLVFDLIGFILTCIIDLCSKAFFAVLFMSSVRQESALQQ